MKALKFGFLNICDKNEPTAELSSTTLPSVPANIVLWSTLRFPQKELRKIQKYIILVLFIRVNEQRDISFWSVDEKEMYNVKLQAKC